MGRPLLIKNLPCSLRIGPIHHYVPESLFIVISRDVLPNAESILVCRRKRYGDDRSWWSVEPPNVSELKKLPPHQQVVGQIHEIYRVIDSYRPIIGANRFLDVTYEELCANTKSIQQRFEAFLGRHKVKIQRRAELPDGFCRVPRDLIDEETRERLRAYIQAGC